MDKGKFRRDVKLLIFVPLDGVDDSNLNNETVTIVSRLDVAKFLIE